MGLSRLGNERFFEEDLVDESVHVGSKAHRLPLTNINQGAFAQFKLIQRASEDVAFSIRKCASSGRASKPTKHLRWSEVEEVDALGFDLPASFEVLKDDARRMESQQEPF